MSAATFGTTENFFYLLFIFFRQIYSTPATYFFAYLCHLKSSFHRFLLCYLQYDDSTERTKIKNLKRLSQQKCETFISIPFIYRYTPRTFILFCPILISRGHIPSLLGGKYGFLHKLRVPELNIKLINNLY